MIEKLKNLLNKMSGILMSADDLLYWEVDALHLRYRLAVKEIATLEFSI
jgi:hypothetical protein